MPDPTDPPRHTIDDHMFGDFYDHEHGPDADHDHDDIDPGPLEENPIWLRDNVSLTSVGIDIGSAGTQVIFSTVHLQRKADSHASRYVIVDRATAYQSPVSLTPYAGALIDAAALGAIIDNAYAGATIRPADIDTGVVILTGEALRRENAQAIADIVSAKGGDFVTATAGNHMEALLASYGSGAAKASHDAGSRILNVDIGGGTTNLAVCDAGEVVWTAALHIGGRLIAVQDGKVIRAEEAGIHLAAQAGVTVALGDALSADDLRRVAIHFADALQTAVRQRPLPDAVADLFLTDIPDDIDPLDGIMVSGGVGEYVAGRESRDFGDLGLPLGQALRDRAAAGDLGAPLIPAAACIRATALGASEYSVQLSGQTSTVTAPGKLLPRRSMQVLKPALDLADEPGAGRISAAIRDHFAAFDLTPATDEVALAFDFDLPPDYASIRALADGIAEAMAPRLQGDHPLFVMIDGDIAQTLGGILRDEIGVENELLILDGLSLRDFDYVDLGKIRLPSYTVPVTVKSLLFSDDPRGPRRAERRQFGPRGHDHHHDHHHHPHAHPHVKRR
ncbi:MAG: recombinase [Rhodobacteraceae bacterium]|nr:recombinase [Paracoccaceae bacterium]